MPPSRAPWMAFTDFSMASQSRAISAAAVDPESYSLAPSPSAKAAEKFARWVIWPPHTGICSAPRISRAWVTVGDSTSCRFGGAALMTTAYGRRASRANSMVSLTASRSNTPGRQGMTTRVAARMASVTLAERFGAVSMKTHSTPSCLACLTTSAMLRCADLIGRSSAPPPASRNLCQSASEPWGSVSMSRLGRDGLCACAARWAVNVLLPEPPLRDAKTMTSMTPLQSYSGCPGILQEQGAASILDAARTQISSRLRKLEHKIVHRHVRLEAGEVVGIAGVTPEIAFGNDAETDPLELLAHGALLDPVQRVADGGPLPGQRRMVSQHQKASGLERGKHFAIHFGAIDTHVGRVVVVEKERDQVEIMD